MKRLLKFAGDCKLETITANTALQFRNYLLDRVKRTTASIRLRSLRTSFEWGVTKPGEKHLRINPFRQKGLIPSSKEKPKNLSLTPDERARFLAAVDDHHHDLLLRFMLLSGARRSETANLQWNDIDLSNKVIHIQQTKTHRSRIVPISVELMQVVMALDRSKPRPFNYTPNSISRVFRIYRRKAGLREELHCHSLRHSCATQLANQGIPLHKVKDFMGHSSLEITQIYLHTSDEEMREVAEAVTCLG